MNIIKVCFKHIWNFYKCMYIYTPGGGASFGKESSGKGFRSEPLPRNGGLLLYDLLGALRDHSRFPPVSSLN